MACLCVRPRGPPTPPNVVNTFAFARGIPFIPPVKFVLMALQQLLFFYQSEQVLFRQCILI